MKKTLTNESKRRARPSPMEHPQHQYPQETAALQEIALGCGLVEKIKWGKPCFMDQNKNIALIQRFNSYIALLFFKGALLEDPKQLLVRIGKHMQAPRQLRFKSVSEINNLRTTIADFIARAIDLERSGARVQREKVPELKIPIELQSRLDSERSLHKAFFALTPGRQKGYIYQIAGAKQSSTRTVRVDKFVPRILAGKGLND